MTYDDKILIAYFIMDFDIYQTGFRSLDICKSNYRDDSDDDETLRQIFMNFPKHFEEEVFTRKIVNRYIEKM